ncbi:MAG: hypothetical protein KME45_18060 [Stenomitos rutilans HA7619-LM2]|jgi:hypothetical protein|nr:hypothetical protein [Stenomitos rutilans HA7619-LM2]
MAGFDFFSASKNRAFSKPSGLPKDTFRKIQLANGINGVYKVGCGTYCISILEWKYQGVLYQIGGKGGQQEWWARIANSAIAAGPR